MMSLVRAQQGEPNKEPRFGEVPCLFPLPPSCSDRAIMIRKRNARRPLNKEKAFSRAVWAPGAPFRFERPPGCPARIIRCRWFEPNRGSHQRNLFCLPRQKGFFLLQVLFETVSCFFLNYQEVDFQIILRYNKSTGRYHLIIFNRRNMYDVNNRTKYQTPSQKC